MMGLSVPAANGAIVSGTSAADIALQESLLIRDKNRRELYRPLKDPVVAPMRWGYIERLGLYWVGYQEDGGLTDQGHVLDHSLFLS